MKHHQERQMSNMRFLTVARCLAETKSDQSCGSNLEQNLDGLTCLKHGTEFDLDAEYGFPIFAPPNSEKKR